MTDDVHTTGTVPSSTTPGTRRNEIIAIVLAALVVAFAVTNSRSTKVTWIVGSSKAPLFVVIAVCVAIGFLVGFVVARRRAKH